MAIITNTAAIPEVPADFHLLEIEDIDVLQQPAFNDPDTLEDRLKVALRVRTPDVSDETFHVWMSPKLGEKAVFGSIVKSILGSTPNSPDFDTDTLIGRRFRSFTSHNAKGWPTLVAGTAAPETPHKAKKNSTVAVEEPPF